MSAKLSAKLTALPTDDFIETQPSKEVVRVEDIESYLAEHTFDFKKVPEEHDTILYYKDIPIGSKSNIITITGKAKSRKTVIASALASSFFMNETMNFLGFNSRIEKGKTVLHIDTEQGYKHYYESVMRIFRDAGVDVSGVADIFTSIHTRDAEVKFRIELIEYLLEKLKPGALILDGVTDLVYDINSQEEAVRVGEKILRWSYKYNLVVITVIHTTKGTGYMTGAIGTYLEKKCETSIKVEKDEEKADYSHVSCHLSRNKSFPDFTIVYDDEKKQYTIANEQEISSKGKGGLKLPDAYPDDVHKEVLNKAFVVRSVFSDFEMKLAIINNLKKVTGDEIGKTLVNKWIQYYNEKALVFANPEGGWMRVDPAGLQPTLFKLPPKKGEPSPQDSIQIINTDDLPF